MSRPVAWWVAPAVSLGAAATAFTWILHGNLQRLYGMTASAWDLAYDQQVIWNITVGDGFYSSFARANFLGIHFELIFVLIAAIEKLWPRPEVLVILASAGLAATAPAAYLFFRSLLPERPETRWVAVGLAAPIPFWTASQEAARDFFHPENMALAFALLAGWAGIRGHRVAMWALCLLVLSCKEDQVYTVGVIGLLMRVYGAPAIRSHWRYIVYLAAAWLLIGVGVIQQHIRSGGYSDFSYYGWLLGQDPLHLATPATILAAIFRPGAVLMLAGIIASLFGLPLLAPRWLLLVIPPYLADVLSTHSPQNLLRLHYVLLLMFPLIVAGGAGARVYLERRSIRPVAALVLVVPALLIGATTGQFPPALLANASVYSRPDTLAELRKATSMIPADACVSADNGLAVWFANRHTINDFPDRLDASCFVVLDQQPFISGPVNPVKRKQALDELPTSGRRLLDDDGRFQVWAPVGF